MNWNKVLDRIKAFINKTQNKSYFHSTQEDVNIDPWLGAETNSQDNVIDSLLHYDDVHVHHNNSNHYDHHSYHHHDTFSDHTNNHDSTFSGGGHIDHGSFDSGSPTVPDNN